MAIFLKVARVSEPERGKITLEVPKGLALEKLTTDPNARATLERALSSKLSRPVSLEVREQGSPVTGTAAAAQPKRFTPEQVKTDKLARMAREEPVLGKAVEEWNLELME
jgi:hypothetical protein